MVEGFLKDVRHAVRGLAVQPAFALVALASLAVGIGLNSAMFSVVNAVLLRPLPVDHPERLVRVYTTADVPESTFSVPDFRDLQRRTSAFSGLAGHSLMFANASRDGSSQLLLGEVVTANYFDVLGIRAALGRGFDASEDLVEGGNRVVVISDPCRISPRERDPRAASGPRRSRNRAAEHVELEVLGVLLVHHTLQA
jgi:hypothetical protein